MATELRKTKKILLQDLNAMLTCTLCGGYYIDATALADCLHVFCRSCILKHFDCSKLGCPKCNKKKTVFRPDPQMQALVYKMVPGLYSKEMQRREDFYRSTGVRASSSCSDDSVLGDLKLDKEKWMSSNIEHTTQFYSPDDSISLSLEYYQHHLDQTSTDKSNSTKKDKSAISADCVKQEDTKDTKECDGNDGEKSSKRDVKCEVKKEKDEKVRDRRYLQCPAAVSMSHLQKFLRMKYALSPEHKVDIIYEGEVLPSHFNLMDVAYTFNWTKTKPMRFFYRIFTPMKIQPIKIINTSSSSGSKQLQIVPVKPVNPEQSRPSPATQPEAERSQKSDVDTQQNIKNKERLMAHLKLQSKHKTPEEPPVKPDPPPKSPQEHCIFEYEEPDKEEIKRFAENRDREWERMRREEQEASTHHVSKKRKKNKHSKSDVTHKKRKIHAEITSDVKPESIKLKVKLTPHNGHKHKHHRSSQIVEAVKIEESSSKERKLPEIAENKSESSVHVKEKKSSDLSVKEKLMQMRAVRHKSAEDSGKQESRKEAPVEVQPQQIVEKRAEEPKKEEKVKSDSTLPKEVAPSQSQSTVNIARSDVTIKPVEKEKTEEDKQAQKTFLKTFQSGTDRIAKTAEKIQANKVEKTERKPLNTYSNPNHHNQMKSLERQIATLQQQCTIEAKPVDNARPDKKVGFLPEKPHILNSHYPAGFTVSKVESGVKRKAEAEQHESEKRPSLEITLINPPQSETPKPPTKRPPPATIPLERIKKINLKNSGISIIPKMPDHKCDTSGALDLSSKSPKQDAPKTNGFTTLNGLKNLNKIVDKNPQLSNLQMLSKVASEHPSLNKAVANSNKPRPQIPNLQTLKIPMPQNSSKPQNPTKPQNLAKLPKLNEINKSQFKLLNNTQIRSMRPSQNQSIRNIPNPSLLVRQQNQNRLNLSSMQNGDSKVEPKILNTLAKDNLKDEKKVDGASVST